MSRVHLATLLGRSNEMMFHMETRLPASCEHDSAWESALKVDQGWLRDVAAVGASPASVASYAAQAAQTFSNYIRAVATVCACRASRKVSREALSLSYLRNIEMFALRFGVGGPGRATLQSIGDEFGMTRERVRQVCDKLQQFVPTLDLDQERAIALRAATLPHLPASVDTLDALLRDQLGDQLSIADADLFAREVLGTAVLHMAPMCSASGESFEIAVSPECPDQRTVEAIRDISMAMTRAAGAAQVHLVAGKASDELGRAIAPAQVRAAIRFLTHARWLDEEDGWFKPNAGFDSRVISGTMKIMCVADRPVSINEIHSALARYRPPATAWRPTGMLAPVSVLADLLELYPLLERRQYNTFRLAGAVDTNDMDSAYLSATEVLIRNAIVSAGGVAEWRTIYDYVVTRSGQQQATFTMAMDGTPIVHRLDHGVWALTGRRLPQFGA